MIIPITENNFKILQWIWNNLVSESGQADTVQGELLRALEKLRWEAQNNGNINWDEGCCILAKFIEVTICSEERLKKQDINELRRDMRRLVNFSPPSATTDENSLPYVEDDLYDRIGDKIAEYARLNPSVIKRKINPELTR